MSTTKPLGILYGVKNKKEFEESRNLYEYLGSSVARLGSEGMKIKYRNQSTKTREELQELF